MNDADVAWLYDENAEEEWSISFIVSAGGLSSWPRLPTSSTWDAFRPDVVVNAVFDATGVRLRTVPFTRMRVRAALVAGQRA